MAATVPLFDVARRAAVQICDRTGKHHGNGLLLDLEGEGIVVLTCHHVVARLSADELSIALRRDDGSISKPQPARYDATRSRPPMDAVVLRADGIDAHERPFLHALNTEVYAGTLPARAIGLSYWQTDTFEARVSTSTRLEIPVDVPGVWPDPPKHYVLPGVIRLADPSDARPGISGSPVVYEDGVLGLAHFSRAAGSDFEREVYLVPLSAWAQGWPALSRLIEPLVDARLRATATVKRGASLLVETDVVIARFRADVFVESPAMVQARAAFSSRNAAVLIGRPKSGKTRIAWQLLQEDPRALVVIPRRALPPESFETSSFANQRVILFFDDLHRSALTYDPLEWRTRFNEISGANCAVVCTCRDGSDWRMAREASRIAALFATLEQDCFVFTSKGETGGQDLTEAEGLHIAAALGMNREEFQQRFDGTPGSLTLDLSEMLARYRRLRDEFRGEVSMARLLDSAKLLYEASQPQLSAPVVRATAERIRGERPLANEVWEVLQRRTREEGFGQIDTSSGHFQIYKPYLEECIDYQPSLDEFDHLINVLKDASDFEGLEHLGQALFMRYHNYVSAEKAIREAMAGGREEAEWLLGPILSSQKDKAAETEQFYKSRLAAGRDSWIHFGNFLMNLPGREADAEAAYREAIRIGKGGEVSLGHWSLANLLSRQPGRQSEVEAAYRYAAEHGLFMAAFSLASFLANQTGREREAEDAARAAIADAERQIAGIEQQDSKLEKNPAQSPSLFLRDLMKQAWFEIGVVVARDPNRVEACEDAYRRAIALGSGEAAVNLGLILATRPEGGAEAEAMFRKGVAAKIAVAYYNLAVLIQEQPGRLQEAEAVLRDALREGHEEAHRLLGMLLINQPGREVEAEKELRLAISADDLNAWGQLGYLLSRMEGREDEAEAAYRAGIEAGFTDLYQYLGDLLAPLASRRADAAEAFRQAAALGDPVALHKLGLLLQHTESDQAAAEEAFRSAAAAGVSDAYESLGSLYLLQGRNDEAETAFRAALDAGVSEAEVGLGTIFVLTDRVQEGLAMLERAKAAGSSSAAKMLEVFDGSQDAT